MLQDLLVHIYRRTFQKFKKSKFILYDKITYAANIKYLENIINKKRVNFIKGDLLNFKLLQKKLQKVDIAINVAAESHVDNSFGNSCYLLKPIH